MRAIRSRADIHRSRVVTAQAALVEVRSGQRVCIHPGAAEPEAVGRGRAVRSRHA
jgi:hypothetical protein